MNKVALWKNVQADDRTAKRAIIVSSKIENFCVYFHYLHNVSSDLNLIT